ncbi:MAG: NIPSNAP family protein [Rhodospirillales bacterium]|nr:NIPSNAP family protein [Rhodospirillales bacterium]MCY4002778.1 NIPSNAP family protein [Rhodospirillales bacterium]MCY4096774.1 NIPSNAP family protein [Rhodospirillales bacterium]MDE0370975.1 NIPSNAP family protein [Rhodospirillales bacterium]MXX22488.1 NIPSNAP family protein [Rhodospirillales bacterium]
MIHELRMYTCRPGTAPKVIEASGTVGQRIRNGDTYGRLEGHFGSEIGGLNQYVHLWSYADVGELVRLRGELGQLEAWRTEFVPLVAPHILTQTVRVLRPARDLRTPDTDGNIYELRVYRLKPGRAASWAERMLAAFPAREKYSMNVGLWTTVFPDPNEVIHLWAYSSFEERAKARAGSQADPEWKAFLGEAVPEIEDMTSTILLPSAYSPRK